MGVGNIMKTFWLKLTTAQANQMMAIGLQQLFGANTTAFDVYTEATEDKATGDLYWKVRNIQKQGVLYDVIGWIDENYPNLTRYDWDHVKQFIEQP